MTITATGRFGCLQSLKAFAFASLLATAAPFAAVSADQAPIMQAEFEGILVPAREAEITPIVSAWLQTITFKPGQMVQQGEVLFQFHTPPAEFRQQLAVAQQDAAEASLREAIAEVARAQTLLDRNVISQAEFDKTEAARDIAAANVEQAKANVGLAGLGVMQMTQKAPFAGVMSAPMVRENGWQDVSKSGPGAITMAVITQLDPIQVRAEVPYDVYAGRQGMFDSLEEHISSVVLRLVLPDGSLYAHEGKLVSGGYTFDADSQKIRVWGEFPNPDLFLRPGLKVTVQSEVIAP